MRMLVARIVIVGLLALAVAMAASPPTFASSDFRSGSTSTQDPITRRDTGVATCYLFIGPMDEVPEGQYLLKISDMHTTAADDRLELRGTVDNGFLNFDEAAVEDFYEQILRTKIHRPASEVNLQRLDLSVEEAGEAIGCEVDMVGVLVGSSDAHGRVIYSYGGPGTLFQGVAKPQSATADAAAAVSCPDEDLAPYPNQCENSDCLVEFAGYKWATEINVFPPPNYFYNGGQGTAFAPKNVKVDDEGLHLFARQVDLGGGLTWAGADTAVARKDGTRAHLGYGTYLVSAKLRTGSWDTLDPNLAFGAFTYQAKEVPNVVQNVANPRRELDLAEISTWGRPDSRVCRDTPKLCAGGTNAQFALQIWTEGGSDFPNVRRYTIGAGVKEITLVMIWPGAKTPVTFRQYNGLFTLDTLPAKADNEWVTSPDQNKYIPDDGCQLFHLNLWQGAFQVGAKDYSPNPPPAAPQEIIVTKFEYKPQQ